jgi:hypothetical protein
LASESELQVLEVGILVPIGEKISLKSTVVRKNNFSVFENDPLLLTNDEGETKHNRTPENIQLYHVKQMHSLTSDSMHPSDGKTITHTSWVMDKIVGDIL